MITRRAKYALKAMLHLARAGNGVPMLIADLAAAEQIPRKFLEQILLDLKREGLLKSRMGKGGGYSLARPAERISLGEILRITDGPLAPVSCVSKTAYKPCEECVSEAACGIRPIMADVREAIAIILDNTSLDDAIRRADKAPDFQIYYEI
jgi:Rrf2 family protein